MFIFLLPVSDRPIQCFSDHFQSMFDKLIKHYRTATGVYLFSKPEQRAWDIAFIIIFVAFVIGLINLSFGTIHSFQRLFSSGASVASAAAGATLSNAATSS